MPPPRPLKNSYRSAGHAQSRFASSSRQAPSIEKVGFSSSSNTTSTKSSGLSSRGWGSHNAQTGPSSNLSSNSDGHKPRRKRRPKKKKQVWQSSCTFLLWFNRCAGIVVAVAGPFKVHLQHEEQFLVTTAFSFLKHHNGLGLHWVLGLTNVQLYLPFVFRFSWYGEILCRVSAFGFISNCKSVWMHRGKLNILLPIIISTVFSTNAKLQNDLFLLSLDYPSCTQHGIANSWGRLVINCQLGAIPLSTITTLVYIVPKMLNLMNLSAQC